MRHIFSSSTIRLAVLAVITGSIATYDYYANPTDWYDFAMLFLPITVGLTILILRRLPQNEPINIEPVVWENIKMWQVVVCMLGIICFMVLAVLHRPIYEIVDNNVQFVLWLSGLICVVLGITGGLPAEHIRGWLKESDARWLALIILIGFLVRVILLETAIINYVDESNFANGIIVIRDHPQLKLMWSASGVANFALMHLYYYYTELFGATTANLRAISMFAGWLTIPAVYLLGRWAFTRRIGLLVACLLAIDLPHIHFSRLAMANIIDPLFGVLAIAFLWRGLQTRSWRWMAWAGVSLGMTSYVYEGGRLLYPALIFGWLIIYAFVSNGKLFKFKRGLAVFIVALGLVASGYYLPLNQLGDDNLAPRLSSERITNEYITIILTSTEPNPITKYLNERITPAYLHIVSQPDGSRFYYSPNDAIILPYALPFLFIGMGVVLFHWRRLGLLFLFWVALTIAGNSLIWSNSWTPRFIVAFPAFMILIALGLDIVYQSIVKVFSNTTQQKLQWLAIAGIVILGVFQTYYYFGVMIPDYNVGCYAS